MPSSETSSARRTLDPKLDVVFKMLFSDERNQTLLAAFLNAVLEPSSPISEVRVLNPWLPQESVTERGAILDVRVRLADGRLVDVEMQCAWHAGLRGRILYYWAKTYGTQLSKGDDYVELRPVISVLILDFSEFDTGRFHSEFRIREVHDGEEFGQDLVLHALELPKLPKGEPAGGAAPVLDWGRFFAAKTDGELEEVAMSNPDIRQAKHALERLSVEPAAQQAAREREEALWNYERTMRLTRQLGHDEGVTEGRAEGRAEGEAKGRAEAKGETLLRLLEKKFGALDDATRQRIRGASAAMLECWLDHLLDAQSLQDVLEK